MNCNITLDEVVKNGLCMSCGACASFKKGQINLQENSKTGMYEPELKSIDVKAIRVCPGKGYDIANLSSKLFTGNEREHSYELGSYIGLGVGHTLSERIMEKASSGGLMTALAIYLLNSKKVQGIVVTKSIPGISGKGPRTETFIAKSMSELIISQGSKYCPVPALDIGDIVSDFNGDLAFIGTPCQIAGLRLLQESQVKWAKKIVFTIANFCGGFRDLRETDTLIKRSGIEPGAVEEFTYRGGGQPGRMLIRSGAILKELKYPDYARATGYIKHKRCRYCIDATGELADVSMGDAWLSRFLNTKRAWSIYILRSEKAKMAMKGMIDQVEIHSESITEMEIIEAQLGNITTKKYRQVARNKLARMLNMRIPFFGEQINIHKSSVIFECKVLFSHCLFYCLEKMNLYKIFAKLISRYPGDVK